MVSSYASAIESLQSLADYLDDVSVIDKAVIVMRAERDALVFNDIYKAAQLAEAQGRKKRALDLYISAVFWLQKDGTPDTYQTEMLASAERQIERLGGGPGRAHHRMTETGRARDGADRRCHNVKGFGW